MLQPQLRVGEHAAQQVLVIHGRYGHPRLASLWSSRAHSKPISQSEDRRLLSGQTDWIRGRDRGRSRGSGSEWRTCELLLQRECRLLPSIPRPQRQQVHLRHMRGLQPQPSRSRARPLLQPPERGGVDGAGDCNSDTFWISETDSDQIEKASLLYGPASRRRIAAPPLALTPRSLPRGVTREG